MAGSRPEVWISDRDAGQPDLADAHQVCLAHVLRDVQYAVDRGDSVFAPKIRDHLRWCIGVGSRRDALKDTTLNAYAAKAGNRLDRLLAIPAAHPEAFYGIVQKLRFLFRSLKGAEMKWIFATAPAFWLLTCFPAASAQLDHSLKAIIIGSGSPQYSPDRSGPSVLIEYGETRILVDAGNGTQARLHELGKPISSIDGIIFTHHHIDHNEEFFPILIRLILGGGKFVVAGPPPMRAMTDSALSLYASDIDYRLSRRGRSLQNVRDEFSLIEISSGQDFSISGISVRTASVKHTIAANAFRFDAGGRSIVVSGDLIYSASLSQLAKGADVLIIDSGGTIKQGAQPTQRQRRASGQSNDSDQGPINPNRAHVTLEETARMAREAGVKTLVLTHFTNGENDETSTIAELRKGFSGNIKFAVDSQIVIPVD